MSKIKIENIILTEFYPMDDCPVSVKKWVIKSYCTIDYFKKVCNNNGIKTVDAGSRVVLYRYCK